MKVSVLINNYNNGIYIRKCLESVLGQVTAHEVEVIIYDDGSTDQSLEEINAFPGILLIHQANHGKRPTVNQAHAIQMSFAHSSGELIFLLDGDDFFMPGKIETVVQEYLNEPFDLLAHGYLPEEPLIPEATLQDVVDHLMVGFIATTSCLVAHRDFMSSMFPIDERFSNIWLDCRMHIQSIIRAQRRILQTPLTFYRRHHGAHLINQSYWQRKRMVWEVSRYFNYYSMEKINWKKVVQDKVFGYASRI